MEAIEYGTVVGGDFSENEIIIELENNDYTIAAFRVAVIKIRSITEQIALEEFIEKLRS